MGSWRNRGAVAADDLARMDDDGANPVLLEQRQKGCRVRSAQEFLRDISPADFMRQYYNMWNEEPRPHEVALFEHIAARHERWSDPAYSRSRQGDAADAAGYAFGSILRRGEYLDPWIRLAPDAEITFPASFRVMGHLYDKPMLELEHVSLARDIQRYVADRGLRVAIDPAIPDGSMLVICADPEVLDLANKVLMGWITNILISHNNPTDGISAVQQESPDAPQPALPTPRIEP